MVSPTEVAQQAIFGLGIGAVYALVGLGFSLIYRSTGMLSFVHPQFVMLGSVVGFTVTISWGVPLPLAVVPVGLFTGAVGYLIDQIGVRPIRRQGGQLISLILATLGWGIIVVTVVELAFGTDQRTYGTLSPPWTVFGLSVRWQMLVALASALVLVGLLRLFLLHTRQGRAVRAVGEDPSTAALMGIDVERTMGLSAGIGGALGGVAGILFGWLFFAGIAVDIVGFKSLAGAVIGGFGSLPGAVVGGVLVGVAENIFGLVFETAWRDVFVFGSVIVVLLIRPRGLLGRREHVRT